MSPEPDSSKSDPFLYEISIGGIALGLVIIYFQLEASGLLSSTRSFVLNDAIIALSIIGILITIISFFCMMRFKYDSWYLVNPEFTAELRGNTTLTMKILIMAIIGFNLIAVVLLFLSFPGIFKNPDRTMPYIFLLFWGGIDIVLWFMYKTVKAREHGESISSRNIKEILFYTVAFVGVVIIIGMEWYSNLLPGSEKSRFLDVQLLVLAVIVYTSYIVRQGIQTGQWLLVPRELKEHVNTIWRYYGELIKIAVILNVVVLFLFALIAAHLVPLDLGIFYWLWLGGILWLVNIIIVVWAMLMYPEGSNPMT